MAPRTYFMKTTLILWLCCSSLVGLGVTAVEQHKMIGPCLFIVHPVCPDPLITFYLYTRENKHDPQLVTVDNITESYYVKSLPNKFILHGSSSSYKLDVLQDIKDEYLLHADVNVWMIDYSGVSGGPLECYIAAVYNLPSVGKCAAPFVRRVMELSEVNDTDDGMHVIGFSLGGQLAGQIAEHLKPMRLPRITGLDPALPLFYTTYFNRRLSSNDAKFVDVIHTNAMIQGQLAPCGHVDFYVNGGMSQPACHNNSDPIKCDHHMAPAYFAESITSTVGFWAWPCPNVFEYFAGKCPRRGEHVLMGDCVNQSARGQYVLHTNALLPYAQGDWHNDFESKQTSPPKSRRRRHKIAVYKIKNVNY